jgi:hypothetical protein
VPGAPTDEARARRRKGTDAVARFLLEGAPRPDVETLLLHQLIPYAVNRAGDDDAIEHGREFALRATVRHLHVKATLLPLVAAWRERGIEVLVIKGFYLAEFVYPHASDRHYHDVDVLVPEGQAAEALELARELGWSIHARREDSITNPHSHTAATLWHTGVEVEVHRLVVHCSSPRDAVQRLITEAAWDASRELAWHDTSLRVLDPRDCLLMGLVLNRAWSDDRWHLKASDFLDMAAVRDRLGVSREDLLRRAAELGCGTTLRHVLRRCDPWSGRLELAPPAAVREQLWNLSIASERGLLTLERATEAARGSWFGLLYLPLVLRVHFMLRSRGDPKVFLGRRGPTRREPRPLSERARQRVILGVLWAARLVRPFGDRNRLRSIALFDALRRKGVPVTLFLTESDSSHDAPAWVRIDDRAPPANVIGQVVDRQVEALSHPPALAGAARP